MLRSKAPVLVLLVFSRLLFVLAAPLACPKNCFMTEEHADGWSNKEGLHCHCPDEKGKASPCGWIGYSGKCTFPVCLDAIPTDFDKETHSIFIKHLRSSTILERSFQNSPNVALLKIQKSNVSTIQPGAFLGLPMVEKLYLDDNRISNLGPDVFVGLVNMEYLYLQCNRISVISPYAFRGLPTLTTLRLADNQLRSVPVEALLQLPTREARMIVNIQSNRITTVDKHVRCLKDHIRLMMLFNPFKCDKNLTWFICNLSELENISFRKSLQCASPPELSETFLTARRKDVCQNDGAAGAPKETEITTTCNEPSTMTASEMEMIIPGPKPVSKHLDEETTPLAAQTETRCTTNTIYDSSITNEYYNETPYTNNMTPTEHTAEVEHIILLARNPVVNINGNRIHLLRILKAVILPFFGVLVPAVVISLCHHCKGHTCNDIPNDESDQVPEPYAVIYSQNDSLEPQAPNRNLPTTSVGDVASAGNIIQPYAVTFTDVSVIYNQDLALDAQPSGERYDEDPGPQPNVITNDEDPEPQLQPHAVTNNEDPGLGPQLQPNAVTHHNDVSIIYNQDVELIAQPSAGYEGTPEQELQPRVMPCDGHPGPGQVNQS
ncbi:PREDICTED: uncharacterized protein LOC109479714 [Branchiostoma belcheri]|uniref:Uncharacterized protein LOC109479714 n=1 Tax=Branchiostoma belcheri TaxID=7741 RepID=A0A6P4ZT49_BRABE|nr:PREDICTED: uncharacterized protein LOC109479714 [Branchiostoma belcheri]